MAKLDVEGFEGVLVGFTTARMLLHRYVKNESKHWQRSVCSIQLSKLLPLVLDAPQSKL